MTARRLTAGLAALGLALLTLWLLTYGWEQRRLFYKDYAFTPKEAARLERHPEMMYAYGRQAESRMDAAAAADYYGRAVARDPLHLDAWLRLAEIRAATGGLEEARRITAFCSRLAAPVVRWKWPATLLAHGLGLQPVFEANINFLVARRIKLDDALFLLETHCAADPRRALALLAPANRPAYLQWAVRWQRPAAARAAWADVAAAGAVDAALLDDYVHFLVGRREVAEAWTIWQAHTGAAGMTNADFEAEPTGRGFDWSATSDRAGGWKVERAAHQGRAGGASLKVAFAGRGNVAFQHVRQIVPVAPGTAYCLRWWWKSQGLTTDQTPFVEVAGYDGARLNVRGAPAAAGTHDWQPAEVRFEAPADCRAVVVTLRRLPSRRFDSNIQGSVWLDDFELSPCGASARP